jgi:hypothetical protein
VSWQKRLASARADRRGLQAMFATEKKDFLLEKADNKSQII